MARAAGNVSLAIPPRAARELTETELVHAILVAINSTGYARVWRNNVGKLADANGRVVTYGLAVGSADLIGIVQVRPGEPALPDVGRFLALEVKRPGKKATDDQMRWLKVVADMGAVAAVVTSVDEALAVVRDARSGLR